MNKKTSIKQSSLGKKIPQILKETEDGISIKCSIKDENLETVKTFSLEDKNYYKLIGCSKNKVISQLGLVYNDLHSDVWMYRISYKTRLFRKNFLYIF